MDFYIRNKVIQLDESTLPDGMDCLIGDNTEYVANFIFDEEWGSGTKTARFVHNGTYVDVILSNDSCTCPSEVMKSGMFEVGVFAGNLKTTTPARVPVRGSILDKDGLPADPTPNVYTQIIDLLDSLDANRAITFKSWSDSDIEGSGQ